MSILVKPSTKVLVQGITGSFGAKHAQLSIDYGTRVVAGVTPGKGGQFFEHCGKKIPIFDTVADAVKQTGATASAVFVPPPFAADAILEGADAGLDLVVAITEGIPVRDMIRVKRALQGNSKTRLHSQKGKYWGRLAQRHIDLRGGLATHITWRRPKHLCGHWR
jgi:succinyl-CoA synthetase alpha subunit